jgi:hypothetical protein
MRSAAARAMLHFAGQRRRGRSRPYDDPPPTSNADRGLTLEQLDDWFLKLETSERAEDVSTMDGYLTAIIVGSRSILPAEWFDDLFGARAKITVTLGNDAGGDHVDHRALQRDQPGAVGGTTTPSANRRKTDEGLEVPHMWCMGLLAGMRMDDRQLLLDLSCVDRKHPAETALSA